MITVNGLTKRYGDFIAVRDVSFTCVPGRVTGFLGPNGAGKTTTMRMVVGLTTPTTGTVTVGGHRFTDIPNPGRHVGVLLDASAQHAGRTGREVLMLSARTMGLPDTRVDDMLDMVGLTHTEAARRVRDYSLGMRQRLGIANAMLGDPSVLILDEPANGLDPAGIRWIRDLLRGFAARGGTVLLSSHLLHEVEQVADDMVLIGHGRIVAAGDKATLLERAHDGVRVAAQDMDALARALRDEGIAHRPAEDGIHVDAPALEVGTLAARRGLVLTGLRPDGEGLEDVFFQLTAGTQRDAAPAERMAA